MYLTVRKLLKIRGSSKGTGATMGLLQSVMCILQPNTEDKIRWSRLHQFHSLPLFLPTLPSSILLHHGMPLLPLRSHIILPSTASYHWFPQHHFPSAGPSTGAHCFLGVKNLLYDMFMAPGAGTSHWERIGLGRKTFMYFILNECMNTNWHQNINTKYVYDVTWISSD